MKPLKIRENIIFKNKKTKILLPNIGIKEATKKQVAEPNTVLKKIVKR
jgi:hypothetical protein